MEPLPYEYVPVNSILMEKGLYQTLTRMKYHLGDSEVTLSTLINDMLKEYLHTYILSKNMGYVIVPREYVMVAAEDMTDEQIKKESTIGATGYREGAILKQGSPSLSAYLGLIRAFAKANNFELEISKSPENENQILIITFHMGEKFSQFLGNMYRILLEEFADISRMEITPTSAYFEFKPKKEVVQETRERA